MNHQSVQIRTAPPSDTANNQDVFLWALYVLGGSDRDIDVEDIYLKCFEMAPARLAWRTQPQLPDYKKTSKALQSVEATTHTGLIHRPHQYSRRLTIEGINWVESYKAILEIYFRAEPGQLFTTLPGNIEKTVTPIRDVLLPWITSSVEKVKLMKTAGKT